MDAARPLSASWRPLGVHLALGGDRLDPNRLVRGTDPHQNVTDPQHWLQELPHNAPYLEPVPLGSEGPVLRDKGAGHPRHHKGDRRLLQNGLEGEVEAVPQPALDAQRQVLGALFDRKDDPLLRSQNKNKSRMMKSLYLANSFGYKTEQDSELGPNGIRFARCHFRTQISIFKAPRSSNGPSNGFARMSKHHKQVHL